MDSVEDVGDGRDVRLVLQLPDGPVAVRELLLHSSSTGEKAQIRPIESQTELVVERRLEGLSIVEDPHCFMC